MKKINCKIKNHDAVYKICSDHYLGLEQNNKTVVLENGDKIKVLFLLTQHVGGIGFRSEIRTIDKNPRQGTIRSYDDCAIIELP